MLGVVVFLGKIHPVPAIPVHLAFVHRTYMRVDAYHPFVCHIPAHVPFAVQPACLSKQP